MRSALAEGVDAGGCLGGDDALPVLCTHPRHLVSATRIVSAFRVRGGIPAAAASSRMPKPERARAAVNCLPPSLSANLLQAQDPEPMAAAGLGEASRPTATSAFDDARIAVVWLGKLSFRHEPFHQTAPAANSKFEKVRGELGDQPRGKSDCSLSILPLHSGTHFPLPPTSEYFGTMECMRAAGEARNPLVAI